MDTSVVVDDIISHHGTKGMKWGIRRKSSSGPQAVTVKDKGKKLKTSGGKGHPAHADAVRARTLGQTRKKSGVKALSNQDLEAYNKRLNLEQSAARLTMNDKSKGAQFVAKLLGKGVSKDTQDLGKAVLSSEVVRKKMAIGAAALAL